MHIDWSALGQVAIASLGFGVGIAVLFAVGVTALSRRAVAVEEKKGAAPVGHGRRRPLLPRLRGCRPLRPLLDHPAVPLRVVSGSSV